jgi:hypothetical protein
MQKNVQCLYLKNNLLLLAEVIEVAADIGEPDCKLVKPYLVNQSSLEISPWLDFSPQDVILLRSDDILTMVDPSEKLKDEYLKVT